MLRFPTGRFRSSPAATRPAAARVEMIGAEIAATRPAAAAISAPAGTRETTELLHQMVGVMILAVVLIQPGVRKCARNVGRRWSNTSRAS